MAAATDKRADLDLQISMLVEHEVTKLAEMLADITEHLGIPPRNRSEIEEVKQDVAPEAVLDEIEAQQWKD
ncbi:hypothetical protein SAMN02927895_05138 [Belnapia rosea]|nr:hypothetical protein SAMN02927895_05138 [Belnapia rosea]